MRVHGSAVSQTRVSIVVYLRVELVWQGLKVDGGGRDLLAICCVVAMCQVATAGQIQTHDSVVWVEQSGVHRKVCRTAGT